MRPAYPTVRRRLATAVAVWLTVALAGCAVGQNPAAESDPPATPPEISVVAEPTLHPGTPAPAPSDAAVLTLLGRIGSTNDGQKLRLDQRTLDGLGRIQATVFDPWIKQDVRVQGVWLADLLAFAETDAAASGVHMTALDDYEIDLTMADVRSGGILLATRNGDGSTIPINDGGPTRIVFVGEVAVGSRPELWIWSLETIDVR